MPQSWIAATHPLYDRWRAVWQLSGEVYEGDGGFLDGTHLVPHPREVLYTRDPDGLPIAVSGETMKFRRRKELAHYQNFAQQIVDTFIDHQYAKTIARVVKAGADGQTTPLEDWWQNVDGQGLHIDDWLKQTARLAHVYGHVFVVLDRQRAQREIRTRADQPPPVLRVYTPLDALDWLAPGGQLTAIKFVEKVERTSLDQAPPIETPDPTGVGAQFAAVRRYYVWTEESWTIYDESGGTVQRANHGMGVLPVVIFYSRPRVRVPILGRPLLKDPKLFKDHFNQVSELRELLRAQTFSQMNVQLAPEQTIQDARDLLGQHAGTDQVAFTRNAMAYVAPPEGPTATYATSISDLERKMYRLIGLPWEGDSRDAESADSRRLKAMDLNRLLAGCADEAERADYALARLWYRAMYGADLGQRQYEAAQISIKHPDEFHVDQVLDVIEETVAAMQVGLGATATTQLKQRLVPVVLPDLDPDEAQTIETEIEALPTDTAPTLSQQAEAIRQRGLQRLAGVQPATQPQKPVAA